MKLATYSASGWTRIGVVVDDQIIDLSVAAPWLPVDMVGLFNAGEEALDHHHQALEAGQGQGTADVTVAALEDLAEHCLEAGDPDGARARLAEASALLVDNLVFGWRLRLKHRLLAEKTAPGSNGTVCSELVTPSGTGGGCNRPIGFLKSAPAQAIRPQSWRNWSKMFTRLRSSTRSPRMRRLDWRNLVTTTRT